MSMLPSEVIDALAQQCHDNAKSKGFYEADYQLAKILAGPLPPWADRDLLVMNHQQNESLKRHALIGSEIGELTEAVRKPSDAHHIKLDEIDLVDEHQFTQEEEEAADAAIRLFDYAGFRKLRLGDAIVAKMEFNASRPHMHGKRS